MGTTSPPADIVTGEHLAGAHKQIELEISPGPLISKDLEHVWHRAPLTKSPNPVVVVTVVEHNNKHSRPSRRRRHKRDKQSAR